MKKKNRKPSGNVPRIDPPRFESVRLEYCLDNGVKAVWEAHPDRGSSKWDDVYYDVTIEQPVGHSTPISLATLGVQAVDHEVTILVHTPPVLIEDGNGTLPKLDPNGNPVLSKVGKRTDSNGNKRPVLDSIYTISFSSNTCRLTVRGEKRKRVGKTIWSPNALSKSGAVRKSRGKGKGVTPGDDNMPPGATTEK